MHDTIVVGAGTAGLAMSWHLARRGVDHVALERGRVGETWRSQRWDSFALNTPAWMNRLPGAAEDVGPRDAFTTGAAWVEHLEAYAAHARLPVRPGVEVTGLRREPDGTFALDAAAAGSGETLRARAVVVASGVQRVPRIPAIAAELPPDVLQLHTSAYRSPAALPPGAVLVVGAAQSGGQVVEDLLQAGRIVHLATSHVARFRRRLYGRDILEWLVPAGFFDATPGSLPDPAMQLEPQPLISGVGHHGHTLSFQWLESLGARLHGRLGSVAGGRLTFEDDLAANIRYADARSQEATRQVTAGLVEAGLRSSLPPLEDDPADAAHPDPDAERPPRTLDLVDAGIATVIWATGFVPRTPWLPPDWLDARGALPAVGGAAPIPGLFEIGSPWLRTRGSGIVYGVDRDAAAIAEMVTTHLAS
jgi:putative flavoprotein involved in K+ transport